MPTSINTTNVSKNLSTPQYISYQCLGESLRDNWSGKPPCLFLLRSSDLCESTSVRLADPEFFITGPDPENPRAYVNFHAFAANLHERCVMRTRPTWAIWAQREAHEEGRLKEDAALREVPVMAAAQWIFWYGQSFFKQVLYPGDVTSKDLQHWTPGPLYHGKNYLDLQRWHFWRDGFNAVAASSSSSSLSGGKGGEKGNATGEEGYGDECRRLAKKAANIMDALEREMTF